MANLALPQVADADADDVVLALQTANVLWRQGESHEAVRWLRRAAAAAGETGDDLRSVALARAAADLTAELGVSASVAPAVAAAPAAVPQNGHAAEAADAVLRTPAPRTLEPVVQNPAPVAEKAELAAVAERQEPPLEAAPVAPAAPAVPEKSNGAAAQNGAAQAPAQKFDYSDKTLIDMGFLRAHPTAQAAEESAAPVSPASVFNGGHHALRVAVRQIIGGDLIVSVLKPGQAAEADAIEALLVAVSPDRRLV